MRGGARRHAQKVSKKHMTCPPCLRGECNQCVDVALVLAGREEICHCTRRNHSGEPRDRQVRDPFDGSVVGPGMVISPDGQVTIHRAKIEGES